MGEEACQCNYEATIIGHSMIMVWNIVIDMELVLRTCQFIQQLLVRPTRVYNTLTSKGGQDYDGKGLR